MGEVGPQASLKEKNVVGDSATGSSLLNLAR